MNEEPRKVRAAAAGVVDLMQSLKSRKKGQAGKVKKKQVGSNAKGGQSSSNSL